MPEFHLPSRETLWAPPDYKTLKIFSEKILEVCLVVHGVVEGAGLPVVPVLVLLAQQLQVPRRPL